MTAPSASHRYSLPQLLGYFLKLGTIGFGGPVALVGYMQRDLVDEREWFSEADYKEGLTLAQLAPGPLAAQLAIYLGYVDYGYLGATLTGAVFVLPSFVMVVLLGLAYVRFGGLPWMQAVFYAVGAAVIGIIAVSAEKLTRKTIGKQRVLWTIYGVCALVTAITETESLWLFLIAGLLAWWVKTGSKVRNARTAALAPLLPLAGANLVGGQTAKLGALLLYFIKAGAFVFGSGLAIVPFLHGGVVKDYHWLSERQFMDAVAVAMITPGPVVITVGFIGFLVSGLAGACVAALGTFLPCYMFTVIPAPYLKKHGKNPGVVAFVDGVTAAAVGTIMGAVVVLGRRSIVDWPTAIIAVSVALILRFGKRIPEPVLIGVAAVVGLILKR